MVLPVALLLSALAVEDPLPEPGPAITRAALEHHLRFLASDELLGRAAATPESARVSAYLARALERAGVEPGGEDGYFQPVPLVVTEYSATPEFILGEGEDAERLTEYGTSFSLRTYGDPKDTPVLRTLAVHEFEDLPAEPDAGVALIMQSSRMRSTKWLEKRGHDGGAGWGLVVRVFPDRESGRSTGIPSSSLTTPDRASEDLPEQVTVYGEVARRLWDGDVEHVSLVTHGERRRVDERNVVGLVRGAGAAQQPGLEKQVIVLSAHFDHVGVVPGAKGEEGEEGEDRIRNGADDDASGTAVLLELAEAFAAGPPPARTVLFLFCAAEERGMLGTYYWADRPTVPLADIVCNLNLEMLGMPDPIMDGPGKPWLTGFERSNLGPAFNEHGVEIGADRRPEQSFFTRSDNIVFVKKGIVGQTLSTGGANPNYHQVTDEADTLDYDHMKACADLALAAARLLADGSITPTWNEGEPKLGR